MSVAIGAYQARGALANTLLCWFGASRTGSTFFYMGLNGLGGWSLCLWSAPLKEYSSIFFICFVGLSECTVCLQKELICNQKTF